MPNIHKTNTGLLSLYIIMTVLALLLAILPCRSVKAGNSLCEKPPPTVTGITPDYAVNEGTAKITDLAGTGFEAGAQVFLIGPTGMSAADSGVTVAEAENVTVHSDEKITCEFNLKGVPSGTYNVKVENSSGSSGELPGGFTVKDPIIQPGPAPESSVWYLAEGSTAWGFDTYLSVANPNNDTVEIDVTYITDEGPVHGGNYYIPGSSQGTLNPKEILGERDFSTTVTSTGGLPIAVDRTMSWHLPDGSVADGHCSIGVQSSQTTWYLPEGSSAWGFECWLLIQNPSKQEALCDVTYMVEGKGPKTVQKVIPAASRRSFNMADDIGAENASIKVESNVGVIPERAMYRYDRTEGHDSIGTSEPANDYYLAEGSTAWGFTTFILVQNPQDTENQINVVYMTGDGPIQHPDNPITMPPNSRHTIKVNDMLPNTDFSTHVSGTGPLIAERAMYWDNGTGEACHDSIGLSDPHATFYLPDGQTSEGRETFTLIQNPNDRQITVEINYLLDNTDQMLYVVTSKTIGPNSRITVDMSEGSFLKMDNCRSGVAVMSKDPELKIMVERAMYWNGRGAGTATIGGFSD